MTHHPDYLGSKVRDAERALFDNFDTVIEQKPWILSLALAGWQARETARLVVVGMCVQCPVMNGQNGQNGHRASLSRRKKAAVGTGVTVGVVAALYALADLLQAIASSL